MANDSKKLFGKDIPALSEPIVIILENSNPDSTPAFEKDDIKQDILEKMGDYVSDVTKAAGNSPSIRPGIKKFSTRTAAGNPITLGAEDSAETTFQKELSLSSPESQKAVSNFDEASNSKLLPISIKKGKADLSLDLSGREYIEDVNASLENSALTKAIETVLSDNNRNYPGNEHVSLVDRATEEDSTDVGSVVLQEKLGVHTQRKFPAPAGNGKEIRLRVKNLKNIGLQTLLEASGEYFVPDDTDDFASVVAAKGASSAPGLARLGIRVPVSRFSAATIAEQVNPDFQKNSRFPDLPGPQIYSHGNVNNPLVPFNAVSSTSSGIAAVLLAVTISTLVKALADLLGPAGPGAGTSLPTDMGSAFSGDGTISPSMTSAESRKKRLGSYLGKDKSGPANRENSIIPTSGFFNAFSNNFFLLQQTQNEYSEAVARGSVIFFGQSKGSPLGLVGAAFGVGESFKHVSENPGYYNVLLRMLIKSTTETIGDVVNSVVGLGANIMGETNPIRNSALGNQGLDINREIGLENDPTNLLNVINSVRESKILKFMDVLAVLGDISLMVDGGGGDLPDLFESSIDEVNDIIYGSNGENQDGTEFSFPNPAALIKKNRLSSRNIGKYADSISWGSNTLRSLYLFPNSLAQAEALYTGKSTMFNNVALGAAGNNYKTPKMANRLETEDVESIEKELDSYYMPFYFHDLRTNEVISFHSFIETITDNFDVEYGESEGYGRIGKVYAYKNTNRSIQCSFKVVATNKNDFHEMWLKINKLLMLIYPQYSAGRQVTTGEGVAKTSFIQPFSQIITSSPVIRMRLGDLIKSNFSDFDLARLFGVGTEQFKIGESFKIPTVKGSLDDIKKSLKNKIVNRFMNYEFEENDKFMLNNPESTASPRNSAERILKYEKGKGSPKIGSRIGIKIVSRIPGTGKKYIIKLDPPVPNITQRLIADFTGAKPGYVTPDAEYMNQLLTKETGAASLLTEDPSQETFAQVKDFFDPEKNPVVKSFDSVKGQGLAGVIKRLSFDWTEAVWETEGLNNRAPIMCKIDIDFAPIYDINPGLDSSGAPIGMPYNVGSILKMMKLKRSGAVDNTPDYLMKKVMAATPNSRSEDQKNDALLNPKSSANTPNVG
jgi:hypothetical protein